jgi:farnesyl diphosphate synthase
MVVDQHTTLDQLLQPYARIIQRDLEQYLVEEGVPAPLAEAMRYCVLGGGKRLRPTLVLMAYRAVAGRDPSALARRAAAAVELAHAYSLVHDDLPAMDNDTLRRGRPTAHVQFGQAMAILTGDALLTRSLGLLAESSDPLAARLAAELAAAAGPAGMIAGQVADMDLCPVGPGIEGIQYIHSRKTAAMIRCSVRMGALCAGAGPEPLADLSEYGQQLGLAFQLEDDLLDATAPASAMGKTPGKDAASGKRTALSQVGLEAAQSLAAELTRRAAAALAPLGDRGAELLALAQRLTGRNH